MRIVLDLIACQSDSRTRGIGRYSLAFAKAITRNAGQHEILIALSHAFPETVLPLKAEFHGLVSPENIRVYPAMKSSSAIDERNLWRDQANQVIREFVLNSIDADVVHLSSLFEGWGDDSSTSIRLIESGSIQAVTHYDLIPYLDPIRYLPTDAHRQWYSNQLESLRRADLLLSISDYSKEESRCLAELDQANVVTISADADPIFRRLDAPSPELSEVRIRHAITRDFVLFTGVIAKMDPRKNCRKMIEVYSELPVEIRQTHQLVMVGKVFDKDAVELKEFCRSLGLAIDEVLFTDRVSDSDLVALYNICKLFVFPSTHEGFGLPVLEAIRCGAVVIGSSLSSIPEVIGVKDALFDPEDHKAFSDKLFQALTDKRFREMLADYQSSVQGRFSWDRTAQLALQAFENKVGLGKRKLASKKSCRYLIKTLSENVSVAPIENDIVDTAREISETYREESIRTLFLDVSVLHRRDSKSGIQRVARSVMSELVNGNLKNFRVLPIYRDDKAMYRVASRFLCCEEDDEGDKKDKSSITDVLIDVSPRDLYISLDLDMEIVNLDQCQRYWQHHQRRGVKICYVVYDLLPLLHPEWFADNTRAIYPRWFDYVTTNADQLVCISESVANELDDFLKIRPPQRYLPLEIGYFHLGADIESSLPDWGLPEDAQQILDKIGAVPSFLMVGTVEPRKGHSGAIESFELMWKNGLDVNLVIVGKFGWEAESFEQQLRNHPEVNGRLIWLEGISDQMLQKVYAACNALLAASYGEGFGLPLIEAARFNLPIIARDIPVFREVAGEHAFYFEGSEPDDMAEAIQEWLILYHSNRHPKSGSIGCLTWSQSVTRLLEVLGITGISAAANLEPRTLVVESTDSS